MFTPDQISARLIGTPFTPLRITTSAGQSFDVHHPDMILVGRREVTIALPGKHHPKFYDHLVRVALMHITALEDLPTAKPAGGNGES